MYDEFIVAFGAEDVTLGLELVLPLRIVEQLAIGEDGNGTILVVDWLVAVLKAQNTEPRVTGAYSGREQKPGLIGTAMGECRRHALDLRPIGLPPTGEIEHSCQSAHRVTVSLAAGSLRSPRLG